MKKLKELICLVSMPAFSIIFIAVLLLDAALYHSMYTDMQASLHEVGEARLAWIEQSLQRYVDITEIMEGRVVGKVGKAVPDQAKLADFVKMDAALRSIQLVQADGTFHGYNQDSNIRYFLHVEDSPLGKVAENTRKTGKVSITPSVEVGENLYDIVVLRPVYLTGEDGSRQFWGYIMAIIDTDIFLHDANITNLKDQYVLCGLFHREGDGTIRSLYENGNYSHDALTLERVLFDDIWIIDLRPDGPWVNPWLMILTTWDGVMTALAVGVLLRRNARLRRIGTTDALTGVYNRNGGDWAVKRCLEMHGGRPALVLAVDIDNFKIINDVYGHEAGDRALCQFTKDMKETFGHRAVITRNGGDEFIIFCGYGFTAQAAQAIDTFTSRPHEIIYKGKAVRFFSSLGFARYPDHDTDYRSLCIKADYALYGAKLNGKARWKEFDSRCISCGSCTVACSTCTCFTTRDVIYGDNPEVGERRRVSASCQIEGFDQMAGQRELRSTPGDRMRFKVLHKFYDYKARFKESHMCVGCGRCVEKCPESLNIVKVIKAFEKQGGEKNE